MEQIITVHIERLPEGVFLATSDEIQGLVAQGRTIAETLEIARDVARRLIEARSDREGLGQNEIHAPGDSFDCSVVVGA